MKKIFYILSICVMTILQPSCDALDLAPEDYYGAGNFWKEASQPKAFMLGLHAQLRSYYDMFYTLGELRGGTQRGHLLAEHQLELCRYPVTEYLGRYSRHIQLERAILSHHASKPFYPRSRKWVYVSG